MSLKSRIESILGKTVKESSCGELYIALLHIVSEQAAARESEQGRKRLYYISAEFLIGKLLSNNLINLGLYDEVRDIVNDAGKSMAELEELELEPSLGNGGLGRLAACFLDSIATLGLNGAGVGLNYHFGLFRQVFEKNLQKEVPNPWMTRDSWLKRTETSYPVKFGDVEVQSRMYDIDVTGYNGRTIKLHLFDADSVDESIVGDTIAFDKKDISRNLTLFLYPDDSDEAGRVLRIYQQYFMVCNAAHLILDEAEARGCKLHDLDEYVAIQINDTHPSMVIPELIRQLGERGICMDEAIRLVSRICAYTNHTILAEALEKWPVRCLERVVPQLVPIIRELDNRIRAAVQDESTYIIRDGLVHMAHLDIHYCHSVNGVAYLHTEILKNSELHPFYRLYPERFNNKTNGVTFRRWLMECNPELSGLITELIGEGWKKDPQELEKLLAFKTDARVLERILDIKAGKKRELAGYLRDTQGIVADPASVFDIQIKRLHEYKRQQLNILYVIDRYLEIKNGYTPAEAVTVFFGAKAAPAYTIAKDIIHLILCMQSIINADPEVSRRLNVVMVENYNVTLAEKMIPACDISEQISLASKEASGTGNMKLMLNGAVTLGTMDGANVEIHQLVGDENIYTFGDNSDTVIARYQNGGYNPAAWYMNDPAIHRAVDFIVSEQLLSVGCEENLKRLHNELTAKDWFMTYPDFAAYKSARDKAYLDYGDRTAWAEKMLVNIAKAGFFSSDRTIAEYNRDIWKL